MEWNIPWGDKKELWHRLMYVILIQCTGWWTCWWAQKSYGRGWGRGGPFLGTNSLEVTHDIESKKAHFQVLSSILCLFEWTSTWDMELRVQQWLRWGVQNRGRAVKVGRVPVNQYEDEDHNWQRGSEASLVAASFQLIGFFYPRVLRFLTNVAMNQYQKVLSNHKKCVRWRYWEIEDGECHSVLSKGARKWILNINRWRLWS